MDSIIGKRLVDVTVEEFLGVFTEALKNAVRKEEEPAEADYYMTTEEVAEYLNISPNYVYRLTHENRIPFSKANGIGRNLFRKSEIDDWVSQGRIKTVYEIEEKANKSNARSCKRAVNNK